MSNQEPLKITLEDLGEPEPPLTPGEAPHQIRESLEQAGQKIAGAAKDTSSRLAHKIAATTTEVTSRSAEAVRDKVSETLQTQTKSAADAVEARLREIGWKAEAQRGAEDGLRWLSKRLELLAERLKKDEAGDQEGAGKP